MKDDFWASLKGFCVLACVVIALWLVNYFVMPVLFPAGEGEMLNPGTAGDMFGGLTALFSGLAFAGLITTLFMQRKELEYQRKELSQTREVFQIQRFENTFFSLIETLQNHVSTMDVAIEHDEFRIELPTNGAANGRLVFDAFAKMVEGSISAYEGHFDRIFRRNLDPYFSQIEGIIAFVDGQQFDDDESKNADIRNKYVGFLRATLSLPELILILAHSASENGRALKPLVERYGLLERLGYFELAKHQEFIQALKRSAFGDNAWFDE